MKWFCGNKNLMTETADPNIVAVDEQFGMIFAHTYTSRKNDIKKMKQILNKYIAIQYSIAGYRQFTCNTSVENNNSFNKNNSMGLLKAPSFTLFKKLSLSSISLERDSEGGVIDDFRLTIDDFGLMIDDFRLMIYDFGLMIFVLRLLNINIRNKYYADFL
jgi:hypothetical protein